jgi:hypothetical protein
MLGQVHVEIGHSPGLFGIETEGPRPTGGSGVDKDLLRGVVHRVTDHQRASLRLAGEVHGIGVDLSGRLLQCAVHEVDVGRGVAEFHHHEL